MCPSVQFVRSGRSYSVAVFPKYRAAVDLLEAEFAVARQSLDLAWCL
jgi:hypothetical protein